jgi:hypothetical protein
VVEWKPAKNFTSTVDAYYSKLKQDEVRRGFEVPFESWSDANFTNLTIANGMALAGTVNASPVIRNNWFTKESEITAIGWNNKYKLDAWTLAADLSHSKAKIRERLVEINSSRGAMDIGFNYLNGNPIPTFTFANSLADASAIKIGGKFGDGYVNQPSLDDKLNAIRLSAVREFSDGMFSSLEFGVNYAKRDKTKEHLETGFDKKGDGSSLRP